MAGEASGMRETVRTTFEARRGVGERSKKEIRGWGAIVSGYMSGKLATGGLVVTAGGSAHRGRRT